MRNIELGMCPVHAIRVAYTGELGWELHHPMEMQNYLWDLLMEAGDKHGMKLVGARGIALPCPPHADPVPLQTPAARR